MITRHSLRVVHDDRMRAAAFLAALAIAYVAAVSAAMGRLNYNAWSALLVVPLLGGASLLVLRRLAQRNGNAALMPLFAAAFVGKAIGCAARYFVAFGVYDGQADATNYHDVGRTIAEQFRRGDFSVDLGSGSTSTNVTKVVTGLVYTVIGPSKAGGFFVFSVAGFWGLYLTFRAFQIAVPTGSRKRYAVLLLFLPSLVFWPSSIGKEAWMMLALGLVAYGAARLFTYQRWAYTCLTLGLAGALAVRPHIAVVAAVALLAGYLVRPRRRSGPLGGGIGKLVGIGALLVVGVLGAGQVQEALRLDDSGSLTQALDVAQARTSQGGSSFQAARVNSVLDVPWATITVLFRPFPNEATSGQALISSLEGALLLVVFVASWRRLKRVPRVALRNPYVMFATAYTLIFIFAFSTFGNFGIITRQRVQLLPFVLLLLCLPLADRTDRVISSAGQAPHLQQPLRSRQRVAVMR